MSFTKKSSREEQVEIGIPASSAALTVLVLPPAVVHHVQIVGGTTAENGRREASVNVLRLVEKSIAMRTVDVVVGATTGGELLVPRDEGVDFPDASTVVATGLETRGEALVNINVEQKRRAVFRLDTGTNRHRSNALGSLVSIQAIVVFDTHVIVVTTVRLGFGKETFAGAFGSVFLGCGRLDTMSIVVQLSNQAIVSTWLAVFVVFVRVVVIRHHPNDKSKHHSHQAKDHEFDANVNDQSTANGRVLCVGLASQVLVRNVLTRKSISGRDKGVSVLTGLLPCTYTLTRHDVLSTAGTFCRVYYS
jgi:hypothetical protein